MGNSTVLSVRIDKQTKYRLARLAERMNRSQSYVAAEAIREFVATQEWQFAGIERAIASASAGKAVSYEVVRDWIASLGTENERPLPKTE